MGRLHSDNGDYHSRMVPLNISLILFFAILNLTVTIINDGTLDNRGRNDVLHFLGHEIGRASCRERVCKQV